jgi:sugar phosphate isomerase/epimerase
MAALPRRTEAAMTRLAYQLYSSRNFGPLGDTLTMLAALGYDEVEGFGAILQDEAALDALSAGLSATGLTMPCGHFDLKRLQDAPDTVIETAWRFDMRCVFAPYLPPGDRPQDTQGWKAFARDLAETGKPITDAGFIFGWHNHDFEFRPLASGALPIEIILEAGDHVMLEFDLAWAQIAGQDPAEWLDRLGSRIAAAHIKDIAPKGEKAGEDGWADVGTGIMDWAGLYAKLKALGVPSLIVEHDNPYDDHRFASASLATLRGFDAA